ncbi:hypothetical protein LCGC14_0431020 [marine sediment metagenome]|uniref:SprT-like domain-containing protein n=1 Tax=marine sediment metagenome TaxID=412755 RepID=A0A0F9T699_9ZZZZ
MGKLATYQAYADRCAAKLEVTDKVTLRWAGGLGCRIGKYTYAHCHIAEFVNPRSKFPRGNICLSRSYFAKSSVKHWHHCIAHEVAHLAVKSAHRTPTFDRRLVALGVANYSERLNARSAKKGHHHIWMSGGDRQGRFSECRVCRKVIHNKGSIK